MNRFLRRLLILFLILIIAAFLLSGYASLFPVHFSLPVPIFSERDSRIQYEVLLKDNAFSDQATIGMDQVYLLDFTAGVNAAFSHRLQIGRAAGFSWRHRIDTVLEARAADESGRLLLSRTDTLIPETTGTTAGNALELNSNAAIRFSDFDRAIRDFRTQTGQAAEFSLLLRMPVDLIVDLPEGPYILSEELLLRIPLSSPQFMIAAEIPASQFWPVWRLAGYRLVLSDIPFPIFPAMAAAAFLLLILLLLTTRSRPKSKVRRQLRRMLRMAAGQLMLIADKAWEPEWCVAAADFKSMVRTARRLKHPIFCYIDRHQAASPAAFFYVYYGENNYCYSFNSQPAAAAAAVGQDEPLLADLEEQSGFAGPADADDRIPLLPETDDSPEIFLANLKMSASFSPSLR